MLSKKKSIKPQGFSLRKIVLLSDTASEAKCRALSEKFHIPLSESPTNISDFQLFFEEDKLYLKNNTQKFGNPICIDFLSGKLLHRYRFGGGKGQLIAKAVGIKPKIRLRILDLTAGLGQDAFVLASLGCDVTMLERSPAVAALLEDALIRAYQEAWFSELKLKLIFTEAKTFLEENLALHLQGNEELKPDIIYFDPMFPGTKKSALVKKEMRLLRALHGDDADAAELLDLAIQSASKKVVVKRPKLAEYLAQRKPDLIFEGKSSRFDVYLCRTA